MQKIKKVIKKVILNRAMNLARFGNAIDCDRLRSRIGKISTGQFLINLTQVIRIIGCIKKHGLDEHEARVLVSENATSDDELED